MNTRSDQDSRFSSKLPMMVISIGVAALFIVVMLGSVIGKSAKGQASRNEVEKKAMVEKVRALADKALFTDNSEQGPLFIQSAGAKEVAGAEYQLLTTNKSEASSYITFPDVRLINNSAQTIKRLAVCLQVRDSTDRTCLRFYDVKIAPSQEFSIKAVDWAKPRMKMLPKFTEKDGAFKPETRLPDFDSEAMWLPGRADDYSIALLSVMFDDGAKWVSKK